MEPTASDAAQRALGIDRIVLAILAQLPPSQVARCARVCAAWASIIRWSNLLWIHASKHHRWFITYNAIKANNLELFEYRLRNRRLKKKETRSGTSGGWLDHYMTSAVKHRNLGAAQLIKEKMSTAKFDGSPFVNCFVTACERGDLEFAKVIADINSAFSFGVAIRAFSIACEKGHAHVVKWLVKESYVTDLPLTWPESFGCPSLNAAGQNGHKDLVYWLLSRFKDRLNFRILYALAECMRLPYSHRWIIDGVEFVPPE